MGAFNTSSIRVVIIEGDPWFVAADVCRALDMDVSKGTFRWLRGIDDAEKRIATKGNSPTLFVGDRAPSTTLIAESGLYKLILRSDKPQAKPFQDWVTQVVLPAIRKDGAAAGGTGR